MLYDATMYKTFWSLDHGNFIVRVSTGGKCSIMLNVVDNLSHVFDELIELEYIELSIREGKNEFYTISNKGLQVYNEGKQWFGTLSPIKKILIFIL